MSTGRLTGEGSDQTDIPPNPDIKMRGLWLYGRALSWLIASGRPPGMIGEAASFRGVSEGNAATLTKNSMGWEFADVRGSNQLSLPEAIDLIFSEQFHPRTVEVLPDLADLLFMESVRQAEISVHEVAKASKQASNLLNEPDNSVMPWVLASHSLDIALRAGISAIVLAIASAEAQVNRWAEDDGGWGEGEERLPLARKCRTLSERRKFPLDLGAEPYQQLILASSTRDTFVHSKRNPVQIPVSGEGTVDPGRSMSLSARRTCFAVRCCILDMARLLNKEAPKYLQYCPPGDPQHEEAWFTATVMTGTRHDPDFPSESATDESSDS